MYIEINFSYKNRLCLMKCLSHNFYSQNRISSFGPKLNIFTLGKSHRRKYFIPNLNDNFVPYIILKMPIFFRVTLSLFDWGHLLSNSRRNVIKHASMRYGHVLCLKLFPSIPFHVADGHWLM